MPHPKRHLLLRLLLPVVFLLLGCPGPAPASNTIETFGLGQFLSPGGQASFLAILDPSLDPEDRAGQYLAVEMRAPDGSQIPLFEGETDAAGVVQVEFGVPQVTDRTFTLILSADAGGRYLYREVMVPIIDLYDVLLTSDKPVYQPGQTIHMRALALQRAGLTPAEGQPVTFSVEDPQGNLLLRQEVEASSFGVAAADFPLDGRALSGDYILTAALEGSSMSESVEVKPYTLPRFEVLFDTEEPYYLPGDVVAGTVTARYFFGKPVTNAAVSVRGYLVGIEAVAVDGTTDAEGQFAFEFTVPEAFAAEVIEDQIGFRTARLEMDVEVIDTAQHAERIEETVTVGEGEILIDVEAEQGVLVEGVDNLIYVNTQTPGGTPVEAVVTVESEALGEPLTLKTDANGLAFFTLPADAEGRLVRGVRLRFDAVGVDNPERSGYRRVGLYAEQGLLLRPDRAEYAVGDTMLIDIAVPRELDVVHLNVLKNGQSHALAALPVARVAAGEGTARGAGGVRGVAQASIQLDGSLLGTLVLQAFGQTPEGETLRAERFVLVNPPPADLEIAADAGTYQPGGTAALDIRVTRAGEPLPGVLGISIVDESVFALGESEPGFVRTYFLLAREMQAPRYNIQGFVDLESGDPSPFDSAVPQTALLNDPRQVALMGLFAGALPDTPAAVAGSAAGSAAPARSPLWDYLARAPLALPLLGIALYDGTRARRRLLAGMLLAALAALLLVSCAAPAAPAAAPAGEAAAPAEAPAAEMASETTATRGSTPPRLRQFFPETLLWLPEVQTDASGVAHIEVPLADTITTWRVSVVASDRDGTLGSATAGLNVFQPFFVEPDLPPRLTAGDEVSVPVSLFNYTDAPQEVTLRVEAADWFDLLGEAEQTVTLGPNEVAAAYVPIRVQQFGTHALRFTALADEFGDAIEREVVVVPNGAATAAVQETVLADGSEMEVTVPEGVEQAANSITVKLYPSALSRAVDGFRGLLAMPYGCFEQVTSVTYPNVLILDYLRRTGQSSPEIEQMAAAYVQSGYQQLVAYEVPGAPGGFSYWGEPPPLLWLTAYGLLEFSDMERVSFVDPRLIERTASYLRSQQQADGSWLSDGYYGFGSPVDVTAYVVWALANAGYAEAPEVQRGAAYLVNAFQTLAPVWEPTPTPTLDPFTPGGSTTQGMARPGGGSMISPLPPPNTALLGTGMTNYTLALSANALVATGYDATPLLDALALRARPGGDAGGVYWEMDGSTLTGAEFAYGDLETTALATHALLAGGQHMDVARQGLVYLLANQDYSGRIGTTQATVFALKSLLLEAGTGGERDTTLTLLLDNEQEQTVVLEPGQEGVVQFVRFEGVRPGTHTISVLADGPARPSAQIITETYQPWEAVAAAGARDLRLRVTYARTQLEVNETVQATARLEYQAATPANMLLVELGVPPGFAVLTQDWDALVAAGTIARYELARSEIHVYLSNVQPGTTLELAYRVQARVPMVALTPPSRAYDYYMPGQQELTEPQRIEVVIRT